MTLVLVKLLLFGTTPMFLEKLGLDSLADLPPLGDFIPGADLVEVLEQGLRPMGGVMDLRDVDAQATSETDAIDHRSE